tara:strand:+ start:957 stop:1292 length:336 start_codon:yes stop_codon:yes gene_type:complete
MLSTNYRIRLEKIAEKISNAEAVELSDMIWAEKLAAHNASAATILRRARRKSQNPNMIEGDMDDFLNQLDLGDPDPSNHKSYFGNVDEIVDFFKREDTDDGEGDRNWLRRD